MPGFDGPQREAYVALVRGGSGLTRSARRLGVAPGTVRAARKADAEFDQAVRDAQAEAAEPIEDVLYEAALRGEPWAVQMWLKGALRERWSDKVDIAVEHSGTVEIEAGQRLEGIARLQSELARRASAIEANSYPAVASLSVSSDSDAITRGGYLS